MITPRSPATGSASAIRAAPRRSTLKVPIRLTSTTRLKASSGCGPSRPTTRCEGPMPAPLPTIRVSLLRVEQRQLVELIRPALAGAEPEGAWADLGAGDGNFTVALRTLLPSASLTAVDQDARALDRLAGRLPEVQVLRGDFRRPLPLRDLDG